MVPLSWSSTWGNIPLTLSMPEWAHFLVACPVYGQPNVMSWFVVYLKGLSCSHPSVVVHGGRRSHYTIIARALTYFFGGLAEYSCIILHMLLCLLFILPLALGPWSSALGPWPLALGPWPLGPLAPWPLGPWPWALGPFFLYFSFIELTGLCFSCGALLIIIILFFNQ